MYIVITDALVKWKNNNTALVIDVICITKSLDIRCAPSYHVLNGLHVEDLSKKEDSVDFVT